MGYASPAEVWPLIIMLTPGLTTEATVRGYNTHISGRTMTHMVNSLCINSTLLGTARVERSRKSILGT